MAIPDQQINTGIYLPTTNIWEVQRLQEINVNSDDFKELLVRLYQNINNICLAVNLKESAYYDQQEFINGQLFFSTDNSTNFRQVYRKVINFGALPNTATKSVAHGITIDANTSLTRLYAAATNPSTSFIPIPYASPTALADNIEINMDATNINIITGKDQTAYTICYVVIEIIKQ